MRLSALMVRACNSDFVFPFCKTTMRVTLLFIFCGIKGAREVEAAVVFDQIFERGCMASQAPTVGGHEVTLACRPTR